MIGVNYLYYLYCVRKLKKKSKLMLDDTNKYV